MLIKPIISKKRAFIEEYHKKITENSIDNTANIKKNLEVTTSNLLDKSDVIFDNKLDIFDNLINNATDEKITAKNMTIVTLDDKINVLDKKTVILDVFAVFDNIISKTTNKKLTTENITFNNEIGVIGKKITTENMTFEQFNNNCDLFNIEIGKFDKKITTENKDVIYDKTIIKNFFDYLFLSNKTIEKTAINSIKNSFEYISNITQLIIKSEDLRHKILKFIKHKIDIKILEKYKNKDLSKIKLLFQTEYKMYYKKIVAIGEYKPVASSTVKKIGKCYYKITINYDITIIYDKITNKIKYIEYDNANNIYTNTIEPAININKEYLLNLFLC